ncbi:MAG TPA: FGGY family carbohydrate kinase [Acidimicrobiales bacterium]|nr:FGGY family carbohydrate kinase [Acidimicrobiales bacterium]
MILGIDLGTTVVKAGLWGPDGMVGLGRCALATSRPAPDRVEQDASSWWAAVVAATRQACGRGEGAGRAVAGVTGQRVEAIGFCTARQTFVPVDANLRPLGPALVWSDRRAGRQAAHLAERLGGPGAAWERTGVNLDGAAVAAKIAWLGENEPEPLRGARWLLGPRDLVAGRMTGRVVTDETVASRSGLYDRAGSVVTALAGPDPGRLPPVVAPGALVGSLLPEPAAELGLAPGVPVVAGAGDRACEVLGTGGGPDRPMVSWGTTANLSVPGTGRGVVPPGLVLSRAAVTVGAAGHLIEAGLSGAGSVLDWLAALTSTSVEVLARDAGRIAPGADGALAVPWFDGARAPWWRAEAGGAFLGLSAAHTPAHLARAVFEGVATDVARVIEVVVGAGAAPPPTELYLCGGGAARRPWPEILAAVTGVPVTRRRSPEAGSAGAALIAGEACGIPLALETMNPVTSTEAPDPEARAVYSARRGDAEQAAQAVLGLLPE